MDHHFDTSSVFEISKFDISKFACTCHRAQYRVVIHIACFVVKSILPFWLPEQIYLKRSVSHATYHWCRCQTGCPLTPTETWNRRNESLHVKTNNMACALLRMNILDLIVCLGMNSVYRKIPKFSDTRKLCCNLPKIQTRVQTLGYFVKKCKWNSKSEDPDQTAP